MKNVIYFSGEDVEVNGIETKMYLHYRIDKESLYHINKGLELSKDEAMDLSIYDYGRMIYNQLTGKITIELDKYEQNFDYKVIETLWARDKFFRVIADIEA